MTSPIGGTSAAPQAAPQQSLKGVSGMTSDDFMKLLVAQLRYQDPTAPSDATTFMAQTAQLTQVDTMNALAQSQRDLLVATLSSQASGLIGRTVDYLDSAGARVTGTVTGATFGTSPTVRIDGSDVPLGSIISQAG
ncbi:flagellar hook capping FlgD N-terminal domain-containing protein [Actinophytocola sp.]|uniref:flagellar hook capping FlgD N-terminal domain-containing protein n=1 Tax=Actinophytocola sp. TaxID=1872138 RepID=UPI002D7EB67A|nr:flagellar hook capping FlgD N-terminal domain-containing protein [Actinophytocola sp.]HET9143762.1 flagellar hook capping FlgD N-terminal domain-containing protein [Actinophytocola sp.]